MALADGLVGYWSPWLGSSGYTLLDRTVYANHGTLTNMDAGTDWTGSSIQGRFGYTLDFDGSNDHVVNSTWSALPSPNRFTSLYWVRYNGNATRIEVGQFFGADSINQGHFLYRNSTGKVVSEFGSGTAAATGTSTILGGTWNLIAATYDGSVNRSYLNGILEASTNYTNANITTKRIVIGAYYFGSSPSLPLIGKIAESAVYNRALAASEILQLYRLGPGWYRPYAKRGYGYALAGFKAYWHRRETQIIGGGLR